MRSIRKFFSITLLALTIWAGATTARAQGTAESPGAHNAPTSEILSVSVEGTAESPGYLGTAESPGFLATVMVYLSVIV